MNHFESFAARLEQDPRLRHRVQAVEGESRLEVVEELSRVARSFGIELSPEELERAFGGTSGSRDLTVDELKKVNGGRASVDPRLTSALRAKLGSRARALLGEA